MRVGIDQGMWAGVRVVLRKKRKRLGYTRSRVGCGGRKNHG